MQLKEILTSEIYAGLKKIEYKSEPQKDKKKITTKDDYSVISLTQKEISVLVIREVILEFKQGYTLHIEVEMRRTAQKGLDLTAVFNEEEIAKNISNISEPIMNYISVLISQITSSFNRPPVVTAPMFIKAN